MDSNSTADNSQKQSSDDQQNIVTGAANSSTLNLSRSDGNNINVSTTNTVSDFGAVGKAYDFANSVTSGAAKVTMEAGDNMYRTAKDAMANVSDAYDIAFKRANDASRASFDGLAGVTGNAMSSIKDAYTSSAKFTDIAMSNVQQAYKDNAAITKDAYSKSAANAQDAYKDTANTLADAYKTSKAGEQKMMAAGALAIIAIVAIKVMK